MYFNADKSAVLDTVPLMRRAGGGFRGMTVMDTTSLAAVPPSYANAPMGPRSEFFRPNVLLGSLGQTGENTTLTLASSLIGLALSFAFVVGASYVGSRLAIRRS